jgi:hypothetical protein
MYWQVADRPGRKVRIISALSIWRVRSKGFVILERIGNANAREGERI